MELRKILHVDGFDDRFDADAVDGFLQAILPPEDLVVLYFSFDDDGVVSHCKCRGGEGGPGDGRGVEGTVVDDDAELYPAKDHLEVAVLSPPSRRGNVGGDRRQLFDEESDGWQGGLANDAIKWCCLEICVDHLFDGDDVGGGQHGGRSLSTVASGRGRSRGGRYLLTVASGGDGRSLLTVASGGDGRSLLTVASGGGHGGGGRSLSTVASGSLCRRWRRAGVAVASGGLCRRWRWSGVAVAGT